MILDHRLKEINVHLNHQKKEWLKLIIILSVRLS